MKMRVLLGVLAVVVVCAPVSATAGAGDPPPGSPAWYERSVQNNIDAQGRGIDQQINPDYAARFMPLFAAYLTGADLDSVDVDPFRLDWAGTRGSSIEISYANRYGARISGHLWSPLAVTEPIAAVVLVSGLGTVERVYWGLAQSLAESGYVVMTFDPQGQGHSDTRPNPESVYCDPEGEWREPQEMGIQEQGECAGVDPPLQTPVESVAFAADAFLNGPDYDSIAGIYDLIAPRFVFGALDAVAWLLSDANPWRGLVDESRVGVAGHSAGAHGALLAGNGDPLHRFRAAASWDGYGRLLASVAPRVPTMIQHSEQEALVGPRHTQPDPDELPGSATSGRFRSDSVDVMQVALRGSNHQEWAYIPYAVMNPFCIPRTCNASRQGERVAFYYTLAWFDRYLKGDETARARLTAMTFDDSSDRSSIGTGWFDPIAGHNVPYAIGGEDVAAHLSFYFRSSYAFDGLLCTDMRAGCVSG